MEQDNGIGKHLSTKQVLTTDPGMALAADPHRRLTLDDLPNPDRILARISEEQFAAVQASAGEGGSQYDWMQIMGLSVIEYLLVRQACSPFALFIDRMETKASVVVIDGALEKHLDPARPPDIKLFDLLLRVHGGAIENPLAEPL